MRAKHQEYDLAVLKSESRLRSIVRRLSVEAAGVTDAEIEDLTRTMVALDVSLAAEKDAANEVLPADLDANVQAELGRYRKERRTSSERR